ncbi:MULTISPECIES: sulfatase-like hydrolase/transferase [Halorubrum]|nr:MULTISPECIES: sulfatase-like hydrolase/transferase [Halorubrum]
MERNVILIILDTVRKDYFDKFAERIQDKSQTSFEQCRAAASWSTPSHASILTGQLLHQHGVHSGNQSFDEIDVGETFLNQLSDHDKLCLTDHGLLQPDYGFDKFFDRHRTTGWEHIVNNADLDAGVEKYLIALKETLASGDPFTMYKNVERALWNDLEDLMFKLPVSGPPDQGAAELSRIAKEETGQAEEPFFIFMNFMDAHTKHRVHKNLDHSLHSAPDDWSSESHYVWESDEFEESYVDHYRDLYGASIDYLDRIVVDLYEYVSKETDTETTVLITADHGHNLGYPYDEDLLGHMGSMTESVLHVPLSIINPPEGFPKKVDNYFSQLELGELIVQIANNESRVDNLTGSPIVAEHEGLVGYREKENNFPGTDEEFEYWNRMMRAHYDNRTKYIWDILGNIQKYKLMFDDPCYQELVEERSGNLDDESEFFNVGMEEYRRQLKTRTVDNAVMEDLEDLGYL